MNDKKVC